MTNADKIRAMTDEELANFLACFSSCELCPAIGKKCNGGACEEQWFEWLKVEAKKMGVFIYNVQLPKSCADCPICYDQMECPISDLRFWRGRPENKEFIFTEERHPRCPMTAAEVRPARSRWIIKTLGNSRMYKVVCSVCGARYLGNYGPRKGPYDFKYCPECGAEMVGEEE